MEVSQELIQLLAFFLGLGALYGGIRADLKRLHVQVAQTAKVATQTRKRVKRHARKVGRACPHKLKEEGQGWRGVHVQWPAEERRRPQ